jgi:glutathione synthase/RimK-type ligase-like ATP-grasp enzyme
MYTECVHSGGYVLQEYLPGAEADWKVLVLADRFWVLRREVRPGDFRASGSGRFAHVDPPERVLALARDVALRLDAPLLSLDIVATDARCALVEFQALHFGTYTLQEAPHCYEPVGQSWRKVAGRFDVESEFARAIASYLAEPPAA